MKKENIRLEIMQQRINHNMTQTALAEKLNTSQRSVSMWENGEVIPRKTACIKLSQVFGLPIDYFFADLDEEPEEKKLSETDCSKIVSSQPPEINQAFERLLKHYGDVDTAIDHLKEFNRCK